MRPNNGGRVMFLTLMGIFSKSYIQRSGLERSTDDKREVAKVDAQAASA